MTSVVKQEDSFEKRTNDKLSAIVRVLSLMNNHYYEQLCSLHDKSSKLVYAQLCMWCSFKTCTVH